MFTGLQEQDFTKTSTTQEHPLGTLGADTDGSIYRYVQNIDIAVTDGMALCIGSATNPFIVSGDRSGGSAINSVPAGVAVGSIAQDSYGWILVSGYKSNVLSDGSVAVGEALIAHSSTDGGVDSGAAASTVVITVHQSFGLATAADTTTRVTAKISTL